MQRINLSLHEIFPDPENMRFHDEKNLQIIMDVLLRHGQYRDFVIQKSNHIIRVGNGMYEAMKRLNWQDKVKCVVLDLTDDMGRVLSILDNRASDLSGTDEEMLASQLQALDEAVRAFCGYLPEEIDALLGDVPVPEFREEQKVSSEDTLGIKFAPMPWILCVPACPLVSKGESAGSTPTIFTPLIFSFSTSPTPVIVPPVPIPATKQSISPSVSLKISSAVLLR